MTFLFRLATHWEEIFSTRFFDDFSIEQCPLLIGIMPRCERKINDVTEFEYQFMTLVKNNTLIRTEIPINRDNLWNELQIFKQECEENQQILVSVIFIFIFYENNFF